MKRYLIIKIFTALLTLTSIFPSLLWAASNQADLLKAGFLGKFAEFTQYPNSTVDSSDVFVLTFLGDSSIKEAARNIYQDGKIKKRRVALRFIKNPNQIGKTDMLFIGGSEKRRLANILSLIKGKDILTVSNSPGFARKGVHINLYKTRKGTLHFEMNRNRLENDGFKVHLRLMELAKIVSE